MANGVRLGCELNVAQPVCFVVLLATCTLLPAYAGDRIQAGDRSCTMGCSSSKVCLYFPCAAKKVISICSVMFFWNNVKEFSAVVCCKQGEMLLAAGSLDFDISAMLSSPSSDCMKEAEGSLHLIDSGGGWGEGEGAAWLLSN